MDQWIEMLKVAATPVALIVIGIIFRRGLATKDDVHASERRSGEKIDELRRDMNAEFGNIRKEFGNIRKELGLIREALAFLRGQSMSGRVMQLPRDDRGGDGDERDEA